MNWTKKLILLLLIPLLAFPFLMVSGQSQAAELKAYVDQNIVQMGQYMQFSLTLSGKSSSKDPDLSVLQQDFTVLSGMSKSSQTQITNGSMTSSNTWSVTITPKKDGAVVIPPIELAGLKSEAITVVVGKAPPKEYSDVFFETKVSSSKVYVQAQLRLDLKLYIKMADISGTQLSELNIPNTKIFPIGKDRQSEIVQNGIRYYLVEKSYFIYPEQSGELKIPSLQFQAVVNEGSRYSRFGTRRSITANSDAKTISVLGIPNSYPKDAQWLPAEQILLAESFNPESNAGIGEPITRTIVTKAKGLPAATIPPFNLSDIEGLKVYPDQGKTDDKMGFDTITGTRTDSFALIANQAGEIQLADYKLPWWDTKNNQLRYAELPGKQLEIIGSANNTSTSNQNSVTQDTTDKEIDSVLSEKPKTFLDLNSANNSGILNSKEVIILMITFVLIWLITVIGFVLYIRSLKTNDVIKESNSEKPKSNENLKTALQAVQKACKDNNAQATRKALITWGNIQFAPAQVKGLDQLASLMEKPELKESFKAIDSSLYETASEAINLSDFWNNFSKAIESIKSSEVKKEKGKALGELYRV